MVQRYSDIYGYQPSLPAAIVAAASFGVLSTLFTYQTLRSKTWHFLVFAIGGCFEFSGYVVRVLSIEQRPGYTLIPFASSLTLIMIAPALFAASIYMSFGRTVRLIQAEDRPLVRIGWTTKIFVAGDILAFAIQGVGAVVVAGQTGQDLSRGSNIITIGLAVQIVFFGFFMLTSVLLHWRVSRRPTDRSRNPSIPWKRHFGTLYLASAVIILRCLYRLAEYQLARIGKTYLIQHEWCMYTFDTLLMTIVMLLFIARHPSEIHAMSKPRGGIGMRCLVGKPTGPVNDHWRYIPPPNLDFRILYK